jgi:SP family xylose:H+ symportor-like MFS transporter
MKGRQGALVYQLTCIATLGGLLFGYDTAVISGAVGAIDANFIEPLQLSETARSSLSGWTISSALFGCVLGAAAAGWLSARIGRKGGLLVAAVLFLISALGSAVPEIGLGPIGGMGPSGLTPFIAYRILCGVGVGIASMLSPLYIAEIAPAEIRGRLVAFNQLAIVLGMLLVYFVNWAIASSGNDVWNKATGWRLMLGSEAIPALLFLFLLFLVPDTPRWLVMKGRTRQALAVLGRLTDQQEAQATVSAIEDSLALAAREAVPGLFAFGTLVILVGIALSAFQQLIGINAVLYYAPLMFQNMGAATNTALLQTTVVGFANVVFTVLAILAVDRFGRKPLLIIGGLVMGVAMITLGFLFQAQTVGAPALTAVILYIAGFALSLGAGHLGSAVGNLPERHQEQGDGDRGGGAVDHQLARLVVFQSPGRQLRPQRLFPPRLRILGLWRDEPVSSLLCLPLRPGDETADSRRNSSAVESRRRRC